MDAAQSSRGYLDEKIQPILNPIIEKALREKPEDQLAFFLEKLKEQLEKTDLP